MTSPNSSIDVKLLGSNSQFTIPTFTTKQYLTIEFIVTKYAFDYKLVAT